MCQFFSCVSDGKGNVFHFSVGDVAEIMAQGNPNGYDFNSHTSFLHFMGKKCEAEDSFNKWEYDPIAKVLKLDTLSTVNDELYVRDYLEKFFARHNAGYVRNLFDGNTGHRNTGHRNTGHRNTGDMNTGDMNTGDVNTGHRNTGDMNTGDVNTGDMNTGDMNTGHSNTGDRNTGDRNTGHRNTGHMNTGDRNTGHMNDCNYASGHFNTVATRTMFNTVCTDEEIDAVNSIDLWSWHEINQWVVSSEMTATEKRQHPSYSVTGGFIRQYTPKQAWKKCPDRVLAEIMALPHFNADVFKDISGIDVRKKKKKA